MASFLGRIARICRGGTGAPLAPPAFHSRFGGLWVDRLDAKRVLRDKAKGDPRIARLRGKLAFFIDNGYVILEKAADPAAVDRYLEHFAAGRSSRAFA